MRDEQEKKIADKGWQSMQQLLNRDLPTERKRRPIAWWWFGLLLLPFAILGGKAWWQSDSAQHVAPALTLPTVERPIVQQTSPAEVPTVAPGQTFAQTVQPEQESASKGTQMQQPVTALATPSPTSRPATASNPTAAGISAAHPGTPALTQSGRPETTPQTVSDASPLNADNITLADTDTKQTEDTQSPEQVVPVTDIPTTIHANDLELLALPFPAIVNENTYNLNLPAPETVAETIVSQRKPASNWSFGLTASVGTEQFVSLNSISGGATADWRFTRKWGMRSGLMYTRYLPTSSRQPVVAVEEVSYTNATGLYTGNNLQASLNPVNNELLEGYVYIPIRKLHQVEMPVMLWFEPVKRLRLYSGITIDYTFMGQSAKQNYIDNEIVALDTQTKQRGASRVATNELQRWQLHYMGGVGIGLGRHAELSAFWHTPIRNIFKQKTDLASFNSSTEQFDAFFSNSASPSPLPQLGRFVLQGVWFF